MTRTLIVANQTVGGSALADAVAVRASEVGHTFHLLVPVASPVTTMIAVGSAAVEAMPVMNVDLPNERLLAERRLTFGLQWLATLGATATGDVALDTDTVAAVCAAVDTQRIDEVIVSTLPTTLSRWLRQDLPHKIERKVSVPVVVVTSSS
jgi:cell pole-organizing protein PopZ